MTEELFADPLLSITEFRVAAGGISHSTTQKLIKSGRIRIWRNSPTGHMKIRLSEVQRYLASGFQQTGGAA